MPLKNVVKEFVAESYYHVYNRGVYKQNIFTQERDYTAFLSLPKRHLSREPAQDHTRRPLPHLRNDVELLAYCLMPSHFHLLIYNKKESGLTDLMRSMMTAYSRYFNKTHKRKGALFESSYKASLIDNEAYLWHISRYIHLNPQDLGSKYISYPYSSYAYYMGNKKAEWINPERILKMHGDELSDYASFVKDYESMRAELQQLKLYLADH
ncbi:transposase [Candidatus Saccharibacteria bacterium]|nr:transposase [Candidatus Saccharibacteria bacterium]